MPLSSLVPVAIAMAMAGGLSVLAATVAVERIEARTRAELAEAMRSDGHDWIDVQIDGLQVALSGTAPDEATRFAALATAGTVIDATRIVDRMDVTPARNIAAPQFSVEILRNVDGVSLIGLIPAESERMIVIDRIAGFANAPVADLLETGDYPTPPTWDAAMDFALDALALIPRSKVSVSAREVMVTGIVESEQIRRQVENDLARSVPAGVTLTLDVSAPRPVIAPFTTRFLIDEQGVRFDACAADTPVARATIFASARNAGFEGPEKCEIGLGAPSLEWGKAVASGIAAVARIGSGTVTYSNADISLVAPYTVPLPIFDREVGELERALPAGFSLTAVRSAPPERDASGGGDPDETPEFSAILSPEGEVQLRGRLPSERMRAVVESYAHAHFGRDATYGATRLDVDLPDGWSLKVIAALDVLAILHNGSVIVRPNALTVAGDTGREDASSAIAGLLSERLEGGATYDINVTYIETLDPLSGLPTPEECVKKLNTILAIQKITFEPGSADIDAAGSEIADQLAELLRDCETVSMEIGGHTDSQGRESMNLELSQERANAVLTAFMDRRVLTSNLEAKGYGESAPIADNDTEESREKNRRIEFKLILPEEEVEAAEAETESDSGGEGAESEETVDAGEAPTEEVGNE